MACIQSSEGLQNSGLLHPDQRGESSPFLDRPLETTPGTLEFSSHICFTLDFHLRCLPGQVSLR